MIARGISAPGKAFLCGEYAVLSGAPAIVAAVDRRVNAEWTKLPPRTEQLPIEARATLEAAQERFGQPPYHLSFDTGRLYEGSNKLGLGSSAAVAVASAAALIALGEHDLKEPEVRDRVFAAALRGHSAVAPRGSGADVAAATYGGYLWFQRQRGELLVEPVDPPSSLVSVLLWTGKSARTSDLLDRVSRLKTQSPKVHRQCVTELHQRATEFAQAFRSGDARRIIMIAREYNACMGALGLAAQAPIVNDKLKRIAEWAWWHGGAAKPCGAGGGDLAVAFFADQDAASSFAAACESDGIARVHVEWGAEGVRALQVSKKPIHGTCLRRES